MGRGIHVSWGRRGGVGVVGYTYRALTDEVFLPALVPVIALDKQGAPRVSVAQLLHGYLAPPPARVQIRFDHLSLWKNKKNQNLKIQS